MFTTLSILYLIEITIALLVVIYMFFFRRQLIGVISETGIVIPPALMGLINIAMICAYVALLITLLDFLGESLPLWRLFLGSGPMG